MSLPSDYSTATLKTLEEPIDSHSQLAFTCEFKFLFSQLSSLKLL